ncbi:unnamed protein product [Rotaria sordida]|uniref:Sphingomyelin synthase-like domain-containing protein n=2 Tax=Rotaria sordida TaxID=392033 RepID=A0A814Y3R6_9BILA|nr:unnamed protein product [Rotaria sordida]
MKEDDVKQAPLAIERLIDVKKLWYRIRYRHHLLWLLYIIVYRMYKNIHHCLIYSLITFHIFMLDQHLDCTPNIALLKKFYLTRNKKSSNIMLISTPSGNSHQLTNNIISSNALHTSLPSSYSTPSNPCTWSIKQVEEWLIEHDLNDCVDLICYQHRMNGQRLMNLNEEDVLQLKGTNKNNELWLQIKKLQQFYSSNYHLWTQRQSIQQQSLPMTASPYLASPSLQTSIPLQPIQPLTQIRPPPPPLPFSSPSIPLTQSQTSLTPSSSSHTTIPINQNQPQEQQKNPSASLPTNQTQTVAPTTMILERAPSTVTRTTNHQQYQRRSSRSLSTSSGSINLLPSPSTTTTTTAQRTTNTLLNLHYTPSDQIEDQPITSCCFACSIRSDRKKTLTAFLLALCTLYFCSFMITIVDERLPDPRNFPPLPDLILDNVKQIPWAFSVTEKIIVIEMVTLITIIVFHRHRLIILRRLLAIAAALYFLRSLTLVFTSLPVATEITDCRPERFSSFGARLKKATLIFIGQGMSSFGVKTCGDYLYSGHTCTLILATHFINEYSPRSYRLLHFLSWIMALTGMFFILAGHQHYSIDILVAWVLSSRLFIYYHTLANNRTYFQRDKNRMRIWFPFFSYFEENVKQALPNEYCLPYIINEARTTLKSWFDKVRYPTD